MEFFTEKMISKPNALKIAQALIKQVGWDGTSEESKANCLAIQANAFSKQPDRKILKEHDVQRRNDHEKASLYLLHLATCVNGEEVGYLEQLAHAVFRLYAKGEPTNDAAMRLRGVIQGAR